MKRLKSVAVEKEKRLRHSVPCNPTQVQSSVDASMHTGYPAQPGCDRPPLKPVAAQPGPKLRLSLHTYMHMQLHPRHAWALTRACKQGILRNQIVVDRLKLVAAQSGQKPPIFVYLSVLLQKGQLDYQERLELGRCVCAVNGTT